jgi:hypothetical protein
VKVSVPMRNPEGLRDVCYVTERVCGDVKFPILKKHRPVMWIVEFGGDDVLAVVFCRR